MRILIFGFDVKFPTQIPRPKLTIKNLSCFDFILTPSSGYLQRHPYIFTSTATLAMLRQTGPYTNHLAVTSSSTIQQYLLALTLNTNSYHFHLTANSSSSFWHVYHFTSFLPFSCSVSFNVPSSPHSPTSRLYFKIKTVT